MTVAYIKCTNCGGGGGGVKLYGVFFILIYKIIITTKLSFYICTNNDFNWGIS